MSLIKPTIGQNAWGTVLNTALDYLDTKAGPWASAPATATSSGVAGQIAYDVDYLYICVAANTWARVALAAW